jgi:hypothetical protein
VPRLWLDLHLRICHDHPGCELGSAFGAGCSCWRLDSLGWGAGVSLHNEVVVGSLDLFRYQVSRLVGLLWGFPCPEWEDGIPVKDFDLACCGRSEVNALAVMVWLAFG